MQQNLDFEKILKSAIARGVVDEVYDDNIVLSKKFLKHCYDIAIRLEKHGDPKYFEMTTKEQIFTVAMGAIIHTADEPIREDEVREICLLVIAILGPEYLKFKQEK